LHFSLSNNLQNILNERQQRLDLARARLQSINPINKIAQQQKQVVQIKSQLQNIMSNYLAKLTWQIDLYANKISYLKVDVAPQKLNLSQLKERLVRSMQQNIQQNKKMLLNYQQKLDLINPQSVLNRGFAIVYDNDGKVLTSINQAKHHSKVAITLSDGQVSAIIDKKNIPSQSELI
jgi:exodeoxyribonuclease VII large subunit